MLQTMSPREQGGLNLICQAMAAEPALLAVIAFFVRASGAANVSLPAALEEKLLVAFLAVSSALAWLSFRLAAGSIPGGLTWSANPQGLRLAALGLAVAPGIFGFVHYLFFGEWLALLLLNGGAVALAIKHITQFNEGSSSLS